MLSILLQIWHPKLQKGDIIKNILLPPSRSFSVGERKTTPKGTKLNGIYEQTYVSYSLVFEENIDIETGIHKSIKLLNETVLDVTFFSKISDTGGKCSMYISLYEDTHIAFEISPRLQKELSVLNIGIGFEIFREPE